MLHTAAYNETTAGATTNGQINVVPDGVISVRNNNLFPTKRYDLYGILAGGALTLNARLDSPTLRQIVAPQIRPLQATVTPISNARYADFTKQPLPIPMDEELEFQASVSAADNVIAVLELVTEFKPMPAGRVYVLRGTSATAAVADVWTAVAIAWGSNLPSGRYAIIGGCAFGVAGVAFRFNLEQQKPLPGGLMMANVEDQHPLMQMDGSMGVWGEFDNTALPSGEVLCTAATAVFDFFMWFVPLGP